MNVSNQTLRRRQSSLLSGASGAGAGGRVGGRPLRRASTFSRKRPRPTLPSSDANDSDAAAESEATGAPRPPPPNRPGRDRGNDATGPLAGVVACLSGQDESAKARIRGAISKGGGSTMGRFDPRYVTHLISDEPVGSKYEMWRKLRGEKSPWVEGTKVVTSRWAIACDAEGARVPEDEHALDEGNPRGGGGASDRRTTRLPEEIRDASPSEKCEWTLRHRPVDGYRTLLSRQSVMLAGFDEALDAASAADADASDRGADGARGLPGSGARAREDPRRRRAPDGPERGGPFAVREGERAAVKGAISQLIRRAGGTIYWEPNERITAVLMCDDPSKETWDDVRRFCREHPLRPACVSVDWVLASIFRGRTEAAPPFPPEPRAAAASVAPRRTDGQGGAGERSEEVPSNEAAKRRPTSSIFRGDVFAAIPTRAEAGALEFDANETESVAARHGATPLSKALLAAAEKDARSAWAPEDGPGRRRSYYVVSSRALRLDCATSFPLLAELNRIGARVVPASPVWVDACVRDGRKYDPEECPLLFQPQAWPIRLLATSSGGKGERTRRFVVSVTGFVDASRYGIVAMLRSVGAEFTDSLTRKNTHLICKEAKGQKYAKAVEWGVRAVSVEWLYCAIRFGYEEGSEDRFSLAEEKEPASARRPCTSVGEKVRSSLCDADVPPSSKKSEAVEAAKGKAKLPSNEAAEGLDASERCVDVPPRIREREASKATIPQSNDFDDQPNPALDSGRPTLASPASKVKSETEIASIGNKAKDACIKESSQSSHMPLEQHEKYASPQTSPKDGALQPSASEKDSKKRLAFALQTLSGSPVRDANARREQPRRRGKRDRSPVKQSHISPPLLSQRSVDDENSQNETQFTLGTIRADSDVGWRNGVHCSGGDDASEVPQSQMNEAEDNGESQVLWLAAPRR
ncbi:hypothetical protein ACHAWF_018413 [Thalassiosira exigua]